jgi:YidC/Oxa1 family membrane protein insertase
MTFFSILYTLIITPLELLFEVIFSIANRLIGNAGLSIIFLSLAVNFLVLPLYKRADELQAEERDIQAKMAYRIKRTKETFKGDERFFMIQEYYHINHYKPFYALKSSLSVLLQIPFFIAAYNLLSGMQGLQGMKFGFIADLGKEDAMFSIGDFPINILPILMTLINIVSGIIYTKGHPIKEKVQVYGLASVFLILLYRSPSGLVFYWLLNNVFSLVKNVFYKLKDPKKALNIVLAIAGLAVIVSTLIRTDLDARQKVLLSAGGLLLALPLAAGFIRKKEDQKAVQKNTGAFVAGTILMALITGLLIPSTIIDASALEFVDSVQLSNPILYVVNSMLLSFGSWVLWGGVFYFFMSERSKVLFCKAIWIICGISVVNYMFFGTKLGTMSSTLQYDRSPSFSVKEYLINILVLLLSGAVLYFLHSKNSKITGPVICVGILAVMGVGLINSLGILGTYSGYWSFWSNSKPSVEMPSIPLSKNGKNVVVLMVDRALGPQVPYIFNEKPELKEKFDGFTYYPNTISYGPCTIVGAPSLFGGYEYTPEKLAERNTETMAKKHDESLKVMPVLFRNNGYSVTVCDPPFAGYKSYPDTTIYSDYPGINCYTTTGALNYLDWDNNSETTANPIGRIIEMRNRNFFMLSLMKISPVILQETIYDGGIYNEAVSMSGDSSAFSINQSNVTVSKSTGYSIYFLNDYAVLKNLANLTDLNSNENTFTMMTLDSTHSPCLLQAPDYVPSANVDNTSFNETMFPKYTINGRTMGMNTVDQVTHYHVNIATYIQLGEWFDYLRKEGVYDNTRIILVSDHGKDLNQFGIESNGQNLECFMPLLMVKDFNSKGFTVKEDFMTNADTPVLATAGLISNAVNPFTGKPLTSEAKNGTQTVLYTEEWNPSEKHIYNFPPSPHFSFSGKDPFSADKWKYLGEW